jgi:hypothetical protein
VETKRSQSALRSPQTTLFSSPLAPRPLLLPISMEDSAGTKIAVGCRVAEVDFSFGDGLVESVTVPIVGVGFNVGVRWDDPSKGGPEWSAEGGGRAANHLLVIKGAAAAPEPAAAEPAAAAFAFGQALQANGELIGTTFKPLVEYGEEGEELRDELRTAMARSPTASQVEYFDDLRNRMKERDGVSPTPSALLAEGAREEQFLEEEAAAAAAEEAAERGDEAPVAGRQDGWRRALVVGEDEDEEEAPEDPARIGTRFVLADEHGVIVKLTQSGTIIAAYDDGES